MPDILMIELPRRWAGRRRSLRRFYPILIESIEEQSEVEAFLAQPRLRPGRPDLLEKRTSAFSREHLTIAHYAPSEAGWPFVQLCRWPADFASRAATEDQPLTRGVYTFEMFPDRRELEDALAVMVRSIDPERAARVEIVFPDWSADPDVPPH